MGALGVEAGGELVEDGVDVIDVEFGTEFVEDLDEAAHVGAFEVVGEIHSQLDSGHGALGGMVLVSNLQRISQGFDPHSVNGQLPVVAFALGVFQHV
jgi:hypothetical protein